MTHLLDRVAAFIDGEMGHAERERVLVHLAGCAECRAEVAAHRAVKARLSGLSTPQPSAALLAAITRLAEPGEPLAPHGLAEPHRAPRRPPSVGVDKRPPARGADRRSRARRRGRTLATTGVFAVTATLITAFAVGGTPPPESPTLTPDTESFMIEHAWTSRDVPFAELPADAVDVSFRAGSGR